MLHHIDVPHFIYPLVLHIFFFFSIETGIFLPGFLVTTNILNTVTPLLTEVRVVVCGHGIERQTGSQDAELWP